MDDIAGRGRGYWEGHTGWPIEAEECLKRLWARGYTAKEVVAGIFADCKFQTTRSAVLGKARRLKLKPRTRSGEHRGGRKKGVAVPQAERAYRRKLREARVAATMPELSAQPAPLCEPKGIMALGWGECRFIVNDGGMNALYCAAPAHGSWCGYHERVVYRQPT